MGRAEHDVLAVEVVFSPAARQCLRVALALPAASTVRAALQASGLIERCALSVDAVAVGVWGRRAALDAPLRDGDRIELYRGLTVDPKQARRLRYKGQKKSKSKEKRPAGAGR